MDIEARAGLRSLPKTLAELVGSHIVAAGMLVDDNPEEALKHARWARARASRVAVVREATGLVAYHAGEWAEAINELRAARRMSGGHEHLAILADCERALGRPERALDIAREAGSDLPKETAVELRIVVAGARRDLGEVEASVVGLQGPDLDPKRRDPWSARLFYAYADNLAAAGRTDEAIQWFLNAAQADDDEETDAAYRAVELSDPDAVLVHDDADDKADAEDADADDVDDEADEADEADAEDIDDDIEDADDDIDDADDETGEAAAEPVTASVDEPAEESDEPNAGR